MNREMRRRGVVPPRRGGQPCVLVKYEHFDPGSLRALKPGAAGRLRSGARQARPVRDAQAARCHRNFGRLSG